jgi:N-acetylneuraminic acid mutarotase
MFKHLFFIVFLSGGLLYAQNWTPIADFPDPRHHPVGWGINGKGYVATGSNAFGQPTTAFHEYDPITDTWIQRPNFPGGARSFAIGVEYNGLGYLGFGASNFQYFNDLWSFDPGTGQWTQLASCPCSGRRHPAMIARGGKIYVGLGDDATGNLADFWVYDIALNNWSQLPNIPGQGRHHPFQFVAGNQVFAGMGHNGPFIYDDWYKLDTLTDTWVIMNDFPGEARVAGTQFDFQGKGYVLSGDGDNHSFMQTGEFWEYDHITDVWTQLPPHPGISRWAPGSMVIDNYVYFFGGTNRQNQQNPVSAYRYPMSTSGVSLAELEQSQFSVYPNPGNGIISWQSATEVKYLEVSDQFGRLVERYDLNVNEVDLSHLATGVYFLRFQGEKGDFFTQRFLKID